MSHIRSPQDVAVKMGTQMVARVALGRLSGQWLATTDAPSVRLATKRPGLKLPARFSR